jgi:hypothetical protein
MRGSRMSAGESEFQTVTTSDPGRLATLEEVLDHYDAFFRRAARQNPPPSLPPILSSDGLVIDRGFVTAEERPALLAYLRKL